MQRDMGDETDILRVFAECDKRFGPITDLVNNAGIIGGAKRRVDVITYSA